MFIDAANVIEHKYCSKYIFAAIVMKIEILGAQALPFRLCACLYLHLRGPNKIRDSIDMQNNGVTERREEESKIVLRRSRKSESNEITIRKAQKASADV